MSVGVPILFPDRNHGRLGVSLDKIPMREDRSAMASAHIVHAAIFQRRILDRQPEINVGITIGRVVIGLILMPGRDGSIAGGFKNHVIVTEAGFRS